MCDTLAPYYCTLRKARPPSCSPGLGVGLCPPADVLWCCEMASECWSQMELGGESQLCHMVSMPSYDTNITNILLFLIFLLLMTPMDPSGLFTKKKARLDLPLCFLT